MLFAPHDVFFRFPETLYLERYLINGRAEFPGFHADPPSKSEIQRITDKFNFSIIVPPDENTELFDFLYESPDYKIVEGLSMKQDAFVLNSET